MKTLDQKHTTQYQTEARARWGQTDAWQAYANKTKDYSRDTWQHLETEMDGIFAAFAACLQQGLSPDNARVQQQVQQLQQHITHGYYPCTDQILRGLGQMYVLDDRFRHHIDRHGAGTADFVSQAILIHCAK